jgi:hypothetical protein
VNVNHPIVNIFFDTSKDIGVFTEVMGNTKEGERAVHKMKSENGVTCRDNFYGKIRYTIAQDCIGDTAGRQS